MSSVRHGLCTGGPRDKLTLATMQPGVVHHPDDPNGYYVWKASQGPNVARWLWIEAKKEATK